MQVSVEISAADLLEHLKDIRKRTDKLDMTVFYVIGVVLWLSVFNVSLHIFDFPLFESFGITAFAIILTWLVTSIREQRIRQLVLNDENNPLRGKRVYEFGTEGISVEAPHGKIDMKWSAIQRIDETDSLFRLFFGTYDAHIVPKRFVDNPKLFVETINNWRAGLEFSSETQHK